MFLLAQKRKMIEVSDHARGGHRDAGARPADDQRRGIVAAGVKGEIVIGALQGAQGAGFGDRRETYHDGLGSDARQVAQDVSFGTRICNLLLELRVQFGECLKKILDRQVFQRARIKRLKRDVSHFLNEPGGAGKDERLAGNIQPAQILARVGFGVAGLECAP